MVFGSVGEQTGCERQAGRVSQCMWRPGVPAMNTDCGRRQERAWCQLVCGCGDNYMCKCTSVCVCVWARVCDYMSMFTKPSPPCPRPICHSKKAHQACQRLRASCEGVCACMCMRWGREGWSLSLHIASFPVKKSHQHEIIQSLRQQRRCTHKKWPILCYNQNSWFLQVHP